MSDVLAGGDTCINEDINDRSPPQYILAIDLGTTSIRCHIYNQQANIVAESKLPVELSYPEPCAVELDPNQLWVRFVAVVKNALKAANLSAQDVSCMGITTFRNSFITWSKQTGEPFHPFNMWQDTRTSEMVKAWNNSFTLKALKKACGVLHTVTGSQRFKAGYAIKFLTASVPLRLKYMIDNTPKLKLEIKEENVMFGTIDTWLLWKLTSGKVWATDVSNASSTLLYDTFQGIWSPLINNMVGLPLHILPEIKASSGDLGICDPDLFGAEIPITGIIADQQASMFGHCGFSPGDTKLTIGTGSFLNVNIGGTPLASITGIYPLVGWEMNGRLTYLAEAYSPSMGTCVDWLKSIDIISDVENSSALAESVSDTNGCYFVPAFNGLPPPVNDSNAAGLLIGISPSVTKAHIVRAVLESLAFTIKLQYETMVLESGKKISKIRVDGGVANNDFLLQCLSDIIQKSIYRPRYLDMTSRGAAFMAGLGAGVWTSFNQLSNLQGEHSVFTPRNNWQYYKKAIENWERAVRRSKSWHLLEQ